MDVSKKMVFDIITEKLQRGEYRYLGSGSGRKVFDLGNGQVVKYAKNRRGIAQNETEYFIASSDHSGLFSKISQISEDHRLLIMEKADQVRNMTQVWNYYKVSNNRELFRLEAFRRILHDYHLLQVDLCRYSNWGSIGGRPVIIDYGFTLNVKKKYYTPF